MTTALKTQPQLVVCPRCHGAAFFCDACTCPGNCDLSVTHPEDTTSTACGLCGGEGEVDADVARVFERRAAQLAAVPSPAPAIDDDVKF